MREAIFQAKICFNVKTAAYKSFVIEREKGYPTAMVGITADVPAFSFREERKLQGRMTVHNWMESEQSLGNTHTYSGHFWTKKYLETQEFTTVRQLQQVDSHINTLKSCYQ